MTTDRPYRHWDTPLIDGQIQARQVSVMCLAMAMANPERSPQYVQDIAMLKALRAERALRTANA